MMFAAITPLLLTGAYSERLLFRPFLVFTFLWEFLVYYPVAHWVCKIICLLRVERVGNF